MRPLLFILFGLICSKLFGQCINLNGRAINQKDNRPIAVNFSIKNGDHRQNIGKADETGSFSIEIPCNAQKLIIQKKDFRNVEIPLNNANLQGNFYVEVFSTPLDKETFDRPYAQSEQSDFVLNKKNESANSKTATRIFKVLDAVTKTAINSKICLFYTNSGTKKCFETNKSADEKVIFQEEDIVAIEVEAEGFQNYVGNIIINNLNNQALVYEILLSKMPKIVAVSIEEAEKNSITEIKFSNSTQNSIKISRNDNLFYTYLNEIGKYNYQISTNYNKNVNESININWGLNFFKIKLPPKDSPSPTPQSNPTLPSTPSESINLEKEVIYFEQSDYILTKFAKEKLDVIAKNLVQNSNLNAIIEGHTDNVGDPKKNEALAEFRAKTTYSYLQKAGVDTKRISWVAYGGDKPITSNDNEENKKKNRRVEIIFK